MLIASAAAVIFRNSLYMLIISELFVSAPFLIFIRLIICEINQTVTVDKKAIECKNFIINGHPADAVISYDIVSKIETKRVPLKPFSKCLSLFADRDNEIWGLIENALGNSDAAGAYSPEYIGRLIESYISVSELSGRAVLIEVT